MPIVGADPDQTGPKTGSERGSRPVRQTVTIYGRALGGEAHRIRVRLDAQTPPEVLDITIPGSTVAAPYRLLQAPRTRRPIVDDRGDYLYVPQRQPGTRNHTS